MKNVESEADYSKFSKETLISHLLNPEIVLPQVDINKVNKFRGKHIGSDQIDIITFNYTRTIEKILDFKKYPTKISSNKNVYLRKIQHIHGYVDKRMVVGINDTSQMANSSFHNNNNILDYFIKDNCNKAAGHTIEEHCKRIVMGAELICIFGSSLGDSDKIWWEQNKIWWEQIGKRLKSGAMLIIYDFGDEIDPLFAQNRAVRGRDTTKKFLDQTDLTDSEKEKVKDNIIVGANTDLFNLIK